MHISGGGDRELGDYQATFMPMLFGIALAILLTFLLRETGPKARGTKEAPTAWRRVAGPMKSQRRTSCRP
jgi:hypothetical protein